MPEESTVRVLADLPGAIPSGQQYIELTPEEIAWAEEEKAKEAVCKEVVQNVGLSENFMQSRGFQSIWDTSELLLRAYVKPEKWKGSEQYRSHLGIPILAEQFYSFVSAIQQTLFSGLSPFKIEATAGTEMDVARAQQALVNAEFKICGPKGGTLKQEMRNVVYDGGLYGTGAAIIGWRQMKYPVVKQRRKNAPAAVTSAVGSVNIPQGNEDDLEPYTEWREVNQPVFEHVPIRRLRFAPDTRRSDIRTASWVARIIYPTSYELDELRETEGYNVPSREDLESLVAHGKLDATQQNPMDYQGSSFPYNLQIATVSGKAWPEFYDKMSNVDPLASKWELIEYWTKTRRILILNRQYVLYNEVHDLGMIPFLSFNFREAPDSLLGWGLGQWLGDFQRMATGAANAFFDDLNLNLMGTYARPRGLNTSAQADNVYPGKVFQFDVSPQGGSGGFSALTRNTGEIDVLAIIGTIKSWAASLTGIGAGMQGNNPGKPGDMRTSAGVNLLAGGEATKMQDMVDQICDLVLVPFVQFCVDQNRKLKPSQVRSILNEELTEAYKKDPLDIINGDFKVTISAGTRLAAAKALESRLGFIVQILQAPGITQQLQTTGEKILYNNLLKTILDSTGYPFEQLVANMTDEDKQRVLAESQAAQAQSKLGLLDAQTNSKIKVNENQAESRALLRAQERAYEEADKQVENI